MCTKVIIKLYVAICVIDDMIIHIKKVPEYLQPFASAVVSYTGRDYIASIASTASVASIEVKRDVIIIDAL